HHASGAPIVVSSTTGTVTASAPAVQVTDATCCPVTALVTVGAVIETATSVFDQSCSDPPDSSTIRDCSPHADDTVPTVRPASPTVTRWKPAAMLSSHARISRSTASCEVPPSSTPRMSSAPAPVGRCAANSRFDPEPSSVPVLTPYTPLTTSSVLVYDRNASPSTSRVSGTTISRNAGFSLT